MFENFEFILPTLNPLNVELNPICNLLALLGAHHIFHVSGLRVKMLIIRKALKVLAVIFSFVPQETLNVFILCIIKKTGNASTT